VVRIQQEGKSVSQSCMHACMFYVLFGVCVCVCVCLCVFAEAAGNDCPFQVDVWWETTEESRGMGARVIMRRRGAKQMSPSFRTPFHPPFLLLFFVPPLF
jgi:hypothetical protein